MRLPDSLIPLLRKQLQKKKKGLTPGEIVSICALTVSLFAISFNIYQFRVTSKLNRDSLQRTIEHDKLSVKPRLVFEFTEIEDTSELVIINKGFGPAEIVACRLSVKDSSSPIYTFLKSAQDTTGSHIFEGALFNDKKFALSSYFKNSNEALANVTDTFGLSDFFRYRLLKNRIISSNEKSLVLRIESWGTDTRGLEFDVKYIDVYSDTFTVKFIN